MRIGKLTWIHGSLVDCPARSRDCPLSDPIVLCHESDLIMEGLLVANI